MSDTPIFDNVDKNEDPRKTPWILSPEGRRWIYSVAAALLTVVAVYLGVSAADQETWLNLIGAILNIGGASALTYATRKIDK